MYHPLASKLIVFKFLIFLIVSDDYLRCFYPRKKNFAFVVDATEPWWVHST